MSRFENIQNETSILESWLEYYRKKKITKFEKPFDEITEDIVNQITGGIVRDKHLFVNELKRYPIHGLDDNTRGQIREITGLVNGNVRIFEKDIDYRIIDGKIIEWESNSEVRYPDDRSYFFIKYVKENFSPLITDGNVGSVLRTLIEAISKEIEIVYAELEYIYRAGFIDTAYGKSLDLIVALLGIKRKKSTPSSGKITFIKNSDPALVNVEDIILFDGREKYELKHRDVKNIKSIYEFVNEERKEFVKDTDFILEGNSIMWMEGGRRPQNNNSFHMDYSFYQEVKVPKGTIVSTLSNRPENQLQFQTLSDIVLQRISDGMWEGVSDVVALSPGIKGNVIAGVITVMPSPPAGVDKVINKTSLTGGTDIESDEILRNRAKKVLDVKGKATLESLRTALLDLDGIQTPPLIIDMPEGIPGLVRIIIDGGDENQIKRVISETKAAGIYVEFARPKMVIVDIEIEVTSPKEKKQDPEYDKMIKEIEIRAKNYVSTLNIGQDIMHNQLVRTLIYDPNSSLEVSNLAFTIYRQLDVNEGEKRNHAGMQDEESIDDSETNGNKSDTEIKKIPGDGDRKQDTNQNRTVQIIKNNNVAVASDERFYIRNVSVIKKM